MTACAYRKFIITPGRGRKYLLNFTYSKENGVDKEDLAARNVFFAVALGPCAALRPHAMDSTPPFKDLVNGSVVGWGYL